MIWIDIDNSPHVQIFKPIIDIFKKKNIPIIVTARNYAQTIELLKLHKINHLEIGSYGGKIKFNKIFNLFYRSFQLNGFLRDLNIKIAISHGSRTLVLASFIKQIRSITLFDYEYTENYLFNYLSDYLLCPKYIPDKRLKEAGFNLQKIIKYNGFKEELYLPYFKPDKDFRKKLNIAEDEILVIIRPPSLTSNYHNSNSEVILKYLIERLRNDSSNIKTIITPRTEYDKNFIKKLTIGDEKFIILERAVDGLQLINSADYLFSGGGTMNREAALLGIKAYSYFTGKRPFLDEYLSEMNRLTFIEKISDINNITFKKYEKVKWKFNNQLSEEITEIILDKINKG